MSYSNTLRDAGGIPLSSVVVPGNNVPVPLQGSSIGNTDANLNTTSGVVTADQIQAAILLGKGYAATTGTFSTATNGNLVMGMCVFNSSSSGKNIYIFSIRWHQVTSGNKTIKYHTTTTNPAYATTITPSPLQVGSANTSVATVTSAANGATASIATSGTQQDMLFASALGTFELLPSGAGMYLPSGVAAGVAVYGTVATAGDNWGATFKWIEF